ncbi:Small RNA 2'-O-methyltransferase [Habropoda laboriosa]|uniref:Small RNA 2'-O-methyltransferase n=1 Tax=Habropoda laboriosa TaxID=597456 RepID=A0A0L7R5B7_9HYME|nr:PREDICTED: putative histone-lysine N-methyltransferase 1 [Habropoda laboriosa]KOC66014.1 Small RNA 2'-O-methyltransferase [Habropoda laboriosa]
MIIVLFHVLYLFGKFVYQNYRTNKRKALNDDAVIEEKQFKISERDYKLRDPEAPQDIEKHVVRFFPPAYIQRYVAVSDLLSRSKYQGKLRKIVDFGCAELDFFVYLKNTAGVEEVLCVDIDRRLLESYKDKSAPLVSEYIQSRTTPLVVEVCEGSVTHNDKKLEKTDAVICIELIEHLYPDTLTDLPHNIFGYIKPKLAIITTPNADFNVLFPNFSGFRHPDHKFEWTRQQFQDWAENVTLRYSDYKVRFEGICKGPEGTEHLGCCTQMALFERVSDENVCSCGIEGLFKTVVRHEYPFRVDNRSDEEKILDEAAFYIRHLSYKDCDMEEEVPLQKLLDMLKSFHISINVLQTILEEAGWVVENRESGPVVLVPSESFSDYSAVENELWNDNFPTDEDDWNREPGPPVHSIRFLEQNSLDNWDDQHWDEEPSIIIPQNNTTLEDNTYPFDEENVLLDNVSETREGTEILEEYNSDISNKENLQAISNINNLDDSIQDNASSFLNESTQLSVSSFNTKSEDTKEDAFSGITLSSQDDNVSSTADNLNEILSFPRFISVSRASTSPQPYLLQSVKMDRHFGNDSMCNQSMSSHWMLDSSIEQENVSINTTTDASIDKCSKKNNFNNCSHLHTIYLNKSCNETEEEDSDVTSLSSNINESTSSFSQDQMQSVQQNSNVSTNDFPLRDQLQSNSSISLANSALIESQPQFTSSPKVETKVSAVGKKRRSLDYKEERSNSNSSNITQQSELISLSDNPSLESSNNALLQSTNDANISTATTVNLSTMKDWTRNFSEVTLTSSDTTSTLGSTLNDDRKTVEILAATSSLSSDDSLEKNEMLHVNVTTINKDKWSSCTTEKSGREQTKPDTIKTNDKEALDCDRKIPLSNQPLTIESESKTDLKSELYNVRDLASAKNVHSTESSRNRTKDSSLKNISLVSSLHFEDTRDVQFTSVLKSEKQLECDVENGESKCRNTDFSVVAVVENIELKLSSPETVETPPTSWSPEVMDSGYPNSASAQDMTPEYDLSSIAQDHISDSESPSVAEAPRLLEVIAVENGDLANNNRDGEGNNMEAAELNDIEDLQPLIDVLENDLENENDIYVVENDFPIWLLRILNMANPIDVGIHMQDHRELRFPNEEADDDAARYVNMEHDEGFDSSSEENSDLENNEMRDNVNENALMNDDVENDENSDSGSEQWAAGGT